MEEGESVTITKADERTQLVISQWIYFIANKKDMDVIQHSHVARGNCHDQAYVRNLTASQDWETLDCGWIKEPSFIAIVNEEKDTQCLLYLGYDDSCHDFLIPANCCQLFYPTKANKLRIRSSGPPIKYTIHVYPS